MNDGQGKAVHNLKWTRHYFVREEGDNVETKKYHEYYRQMSMKT